MFSWYFKNKLRKMQRVLNPIFEAHLENRKKYLQFCFQISVNVFHVDGISMIYIAVPRLFSLLAATYITIM